VADPPSSVDLVSGNSTLGSAVVTQVVPVGLDPFGVAYDNLTGDVFVTNSGSANVSVLSGNDMAPIASIDVGSGPMGIAFDPATGDVYVANNGSNNVSVISTSPLSVVASVRVPATPIGVAADPRSGQVFVADSGAANVTAISTANYTVLANLSVGNTPYDVAVDPVSDNVYVTNSGSNNLTVIAASTDTIVTWIGVSGVYTHSPGPLTGLAFDPQDGMVWVGAGTFDMLVINASTQHLVAVLGTDPAGVAYNPDNGDVCVTNTVNRTFECLLAEVSFTETGLPTGTPWNVTVVPAISSPSGNGSILTFWVPMYTTFNFTVSPAGTYLPTPANGSESGLGYYGYTNVPISFSSAGSGYPVTFSEFGLPSNTSWGLTFDGVNYTSSTSELQLTELDGTYPYTIAAISGYRATPASGMVTVNGSAANVNITFSAVTSHFFLTFAMSGLPAGTNWSVSVNSTVESSTNASIVFVEPNGKYTYSIPDVAVYGTLFEPTPSSGTISVTGSNVPVPVSFVASAYAVTFIEFGLPVGNGWSLTVGNSTAGGVGQFLVYLPDGFYSWSARAIVNNSEYQATGSVTVAGQPISVDVVFVVTPYLFSVTVVETGLPNGSAWTVSATNDLTGASTSVTRSASLLSLSLVNGTYTITASGPSGYWASISSTTWVVAGPQTTLLTVTFGPAPCACGEQSAGGNGNGASFEIVVILGVAVGVGVGVAVAALVGRRGPPAP